VTRYVRKLAKIIVRPFLMNRYVRRVLAFWLYRQSISHSEDMVALLRSPDELDDSYWMGKLRQYAHMVDKGLHRGDFSKGHGTWAYGMARDALAHIRSPEAMGDPSIQWSVRKIRQYEQYQASDLPGLTSEYIRTTCNHEQLLDAIKTRRCIRRYLEKPVPDALVEKIAEVVDWAPTSCHRQPARVYATNNPYIVRKCTELHAGAACFTDIYAPLFLVFCADARLYAMPTELFMPCIDVALGIQNCVLVAHTLGLSLTPLTWSYRKDRHETELRKLLDIPTDFQIVVGAVGGYPNGGVEVPPRKNRELFIRK